MLIMIYFVIVVDRERSHSLQPLRTMLILPDPQAYSQIVVVHPVQVPPAVTVHAPAVVIAPRIATTNGNWTGEPKGTNNNGPAVDFTKLFLT